MDEQEMVYDILTFDELLEDEYYKNEFEKRVQQRLDINSHSSSPKDGRHTNEKANPNPDKTI